MTGFRFRTARRAHRSSPQRPAPKSHARKKQAEPGNFQQPRVGGGSEQSSAHRDSGRKP